MLQAVRNAFALADLRRKLLVTIGILVIYRMAAHVPVPGVDKEALTNVLDPASGAGGLGQLVGLLDLLSGGLVANFSVMAMGVYPYVTASIILQLLQPIIPRLEEIGSLPVERRGLLLDVHPLVLPRHRAQFLGLAFDLGQRLLELEVVHLGRGSRLLCPYMTGRPAICNSPPERLTRAVPPPMLAASHR